MAFADPREVIKAAEGELPWEHVVLSVVIPAYNEVRTVETLLRRVRELENALERAAVVSAERLIQADALPERVRTAPTRPLIADAPPANPSMEVIERAYILWVLQTEGGNKTRAAEVLGIDPSTLYRKLNRYGIEV